jgi:predicted transcriptional regulator
VLESTQKDKRYRYSLDIVRDMLLVATARVKKTRIMYQANLSYRHMEKYLRDLQDSGLIECDGSSCYLVTSKGKEFLQMYDEYLERQRRINEEISGASKDRLLLENMCFNNGCSSKQPLNKKPSIEV